MTDWITAVATLVIAGWSITVWWTTKRAGDREEAFRGQLRDLYQALTIATIIGRDTPSHRVSLGAVNEALRTFEKYYTGETQIYRSLPEKGSD